VHVDATEMRGSFRYRLVACFGVGLALQAALGPAALASTAPGSGRDRSPPAPNVAPAAGKSADRAAPAAAAGQPAKASVARPDDSLPELWTPRTVTIVDTNEPLGAEALFDGDATTGFTTAADGAATLRLELGAGREVVGLGVHGTGRAKITIYAEDNGARRPIGTNHDGAINLEPDHWAQLAPTGSTKTSTTKLGRCEVSPCPGILGRSSYRWEGSLEHMGRRRSRLWFVPGRLRSHRLPVLMTANKLACPRCGQDWLRVVLLKHLEATGVMCRECDALWVGKGPRKDNFDDYETYMRRRFRSNPGNPDELEIIGFYAVDTPSPTP
jgi:hypothetical protein